MIIIDIVDVKAVLPNITKEVEYEDFKTYLQSAESWFEKHLLGSVLYALIENGTETDTDLLILSKNVIVLKAYSIGIPFMDLIQTANGFGVIKDSKRAPASKDRVNRLIAANEKRLSLETELLMNYLEDNSQFHDNWKSSPAYSLLSNCLISTVRNFKTFVPFEGDRNDFLFLKPSLISQSALFIAPAISKTYLDELILKQNSNTLNDSDKVVIPVIKAALACQVTDRKTIAYSLLANASTIMENDLESFPTYANSPEKTLKDDSGFENAEENTVFIFKAGI